MNWLALYAIARQLRELAATARARAARTVARCDSARWVSLGGSGFREQVAGLTAGVRAQADALDTLAAAIEAQARLVFADPRVDLGML